jgi:hypothetical protein
MVDMGDDGDVAQIHDDLKNRRRERPAGVEKPSAGHKGPLSSGI